MSYAQWRNSYTRFSFVHLGIILMLVLGFYSGLSGIMYTIAVNIFIPLHVDPLLSNDSANNARC
jgi:hypothetical protein